MSFYGKLFNAMQKAFTKITIGDKSLLAETSEDAIAITGVNGISVFADNKTITIDGKTLEDNLTVSITNDSDPTDNILTYVITQNGKTVGSINIPLDLILREGSIVNENDRGEPGTFLKLTFKVENGTQDVYINVADLNEVAGDATDTITVNVDSNQKITANINPGSISTTELKDASITTAKISDKAVTAEKIASNAVVTDKIKDGAVTKEKLSEDLQTTIDKLSSSTYDEDSFTLTLF